MGKMLNHTTLEPHIRVKLRRHLAIHAVATLVANGFTVLFFFSIAGLITKWTPEWFLFATFGWDNLCSTLCALTLSGLTGAVCRPSGGVALLGEEFPDAEAQVGPPGVVQQLQQAGQAVAEVDEVENAKAEGESEEHQGLND